MKNRYDRMLPFALLLSLLMLLMLLTGCGGSEELLDGETALDRILTEVRFDTDLQDAGATAPLYFPDLPEGSQVRLYTGSGYYADEAALLTMRGTADTGKAMKIVENHLRELRDQFANYVPEEVPKIENAVTIRSGNQILLCITKDTDTVHSIVKNSDAAPELPRQATAEESSEPAASVSPETDGYPVLKSKSGTYHDYGNGVIRVDDRAYEPYSYNRPAAESYAEVINQVAGALDGQVQVYALAIPTGSMMLPDDIAEILPGYTDQGVSIQKIFSLISDQVVKVSPYDNLMRHRDEYLYFHTDYHWNGRGTYYANETFCEAKGISPYPLSMRREDQFGQFLGALYFNDSGKDPILENNPDTVEAFHPHSPHAEMHYTDQKGNTYAWNIIMDVSDWATGSKYSTFAGADNPITVFDNPDVTDGSVAVVVKESYGNALMPFLCDHYTTVYEIDYRYWSGSLVDFALEKQADDLIFANNLSMIGSNLLIGKLANVAK